MVSRQKRSSRMRKIFYRTPGGKTKEKYKRTKSRTSYCRICSRRLQGVDTSRNLSKTSKKSGRMFSGELCHRCTGIVLKYRARLKSKEITPFDVDIKYMKYVGAFDEK
jgi:ribosomal protein L34E